MSRAVRVACAARSSRAVGLALDGRAVRLLGDGARRGGRCARASSAMASVRVAIVRSSAARRTSASRASSRSRGLRPRRQSLVPSALPALPLAQQRAEARGGELAGQLLGLGRELLVLLRHLRLLLQRLQLAAELGQDVLQPQEILVQPGELALGPLLAAAVLRDAGRLLDVLAAVLGAGLQHLLELALADDGVQRPADAGLGQQLLDVQQPHDLTADPVLALAASGRSRGSPRSRSWARGSCRRSCRSRA